MKQSEFSDLWFIFKNQADEPAVDGIDD